MTFEKEYKERHVSVFHNGLPAHLVSLTENSDENAMRRAESAVFMAALKDGREWPRDTITSVMYEGEVPA